MLKPSPTSTSQQCAPRLSKRCVFLLTLTTSAEDGYCSIKIYPTIQPRVKEKVICCHLQI